MMKKDATLINCSRGPVIDEVALTNFLQANENFRCGTALNIRPRQCQAQHRCCLATRDGNKSTQPRQNIRSLYGIAHGVIFLGLL